MKAFSLTFSARTLLVLTAVPVMAQQTAGVLGDPNRKSRRHIRSQHFATRSNGRELPIMTPHVGAQLRQGTGRQPRIGSQQGVR
jgi:hypothetical protein